MTSESMTNLTFYLEFETTEFGDGDENGKNGESTEDDRRKQFQGNNQSISFLVST